MNKAEARRIAARIGEEVEKRVPDALRALVASNDEFEVLGSDGKKYQVVIEAWQYMSDDTKLDIVVTVSDDSVWSHIFPAAWSTQITLPPTSA